MRQRHAGSLVCKCDPVFACLPWLPGLVTMTRKTFGLPPVRPSRRGTGCCGRRRGTDCGLLDLDSGVVIDGAGRKGP